MLSIITVVLNDANGLRRTLESLRSQCFQDFELLIIDGASTDNIQEVIFEFADLISVYISEKDDGVYHAMNKGLDHSNGDAVIFLNAGDYLVGQVFSSYTGGVGLLPYYYENARGVLTRGGARLFFLGMPYCHQAIVYPSSKIRYDTSYRISADYEYTIRNFNNKLPHLINSSGYVVFSAGGISSRYRNIRDFESMLIVKKYFTKYHLICFKFKLKLSEFIRRFNGYE